MKKTSNKAFQDIIDAAKSEIANNVEIETIKAKLTPQIKALFEEKSVLGFDIYRYSKFPIFEQTLIPFTYKWLYNITVKHCLAYEPQVFYNYNSPKDFKESFIDMGDGGFQIFEDPLQCVFFTIFFQSNIKRFNAYKLNPNLRELQDEITLRYAITTDKIFCFENNYYGPAIINNARILAKDKLNRFLIDEKTHIWFDRNTNGVENLQSLVFEDLKRIITEPPITNRYESYILNDTPEKNRIIKTDLLKIGEIVSKKDTYSIYSLHLQVLMKASNVFNELNKYTVSIGNLNTTGISEEKSEN